MLNGIQYIEADIYDYEVAYSYGIHIISVTLRQLSERAKKVLLVCCALMEDNLPQKPGHPPGFTTKQIREKAPSLGLDLDNPNDVYKPLSTLVSLEYLDMNQPKPPKWTKYYTVLFQPVKDPQGNIINIDSPETSFITTPDELRAKWTPKPAPTPPQNIGF